MKKIILSLSFIFSCALFINAQTAPSSSTTQTEPTKVVKKHKHNKKSTTKAEALYECPMKCEPASKIAGKCGKCGMEKVKVGAKS